jgi:hypothetical protein
MQNTYTTKTKISGNWVFIRIFQNGNYWFTYDFLIKVAPWMLDKHLPGKHWATEENLIEIRESIENNFLSK